jgi:hypothetical protein
MKSLVLILALCFGLTACSKDKGSGEGGVPAIPEDLVFDKGTLPAMSDADFQQAQLFLVAFASVKNLNNQILTSTASGQGHNDYNEMTTAQKNRVFVFQNSCEENFIEPQPVDWSQVKPGQTVRVSTRNSIIGGACDLTGDFSSNTDVNILTMSEAEGSFTQVISGGDMSAVELQEDRTLFGYGSIQRTFSGQGRYHQDKTGWSDYSTYSVQGVYQEVTGGIGTITYVATVQDLSLKDDRSEKITRIVFKFGGKEVTLSMHQEIDPHNGKYFSEAYIGDRLVEGPQPTPLTGLETLTYVQVKSPLLRR